MMMRPITLTLATLALAACQPQDPDGKAAPPPADAPAAAATPAASSGGLDISQPISLRGTEPFWAVEITDGTKFRLMRPDHPDLTAEAPGAAMSPGGVTWIAKGAKGEQLTVTLKMGECSDGMSDLKYPMTAEVVLMSETLKGCAAKTAELPKEGG
jgi:uncharacterized membrane protein